MTKEEKARETNKGFTATVVATKIIKLDGKDGFGDPLTILVKRHFLGSRKDVEAYLGDDWCVSYC